MQLKLSRALTRELQSPLKKKIKTWRVEGKIEEGEEKRGRGEEGVRERRVGGVAGTVNWTSEDLEREQESERERNRGGRDEYL